MGLFTRDGVEMVRTHHPFLHPTKGWRSFARPGKANRRRKLIPTGVGMVPKSHAYRARQLQWSPCRHQVSV